MTAPLALTWSPLSEIFDRLLNKVCLKFLFNISKTLIQQDVSSGVLGRRGIGSCWSPFAPACGVFIRAFFYLWQQQSKYTTKVLPHSAFTRVKAASDGALLVWKHSYPAGSAEVSPDWRARCPSDFFLMVGLHIILGIRSYTVTVKQEIFLKPWLSSGFYFCFRNALDVFKSPDEIVNCVVVKIL